MNSLLSRPRSHLSFERLHSAQLTDGLPIFLGMVSGRCRMSKRCGKGVPISTSFSVLYRLFTTDPD